MTDLVVALHQGRLSELVPAVAVIEGARRLQRHINVAALQGQTEPGLLICRTSGDGAAVRRVTG